MKKIKEVSLDNEKREMFESLLATRSIKHTRGEKKEENVFMHIYKNQ